MQPPSGIERKTLTEKVYEILKEQILDRELPPGAKLGIDALTRTLHVSSSPVREALVRLQADRLVTLELYRGYSVAEAPSADYFNALMNFRILTEGYCATIGAPRRDPRVLQQMREAARRMSAVHSLGKHYQQYREFIEADAQFHDQIVFSSGNQVIIDTFRSLRPLLIQSRLYRERGNGRVRVAATNREHLAILHAFEAGDGRGAQRALKAHFEGGRLRLIAANAPAGEGAAESQQVKAG